MQNATLLVETRLARVSAAGRSATCEAAGVRDRHPTCASLYGKEGLVGRDLACRCRAPDGWTSRCKETAEEGALHEVKREATA